jgi:Mrr N-terminal domain
MSLPAFTTIEIPILHELLAVGGKDDVRFLYERLISYFPQMEDSEVRQIKLGSSKNWRNAVQRAAKSLDDKSLIKRERGLWTITERGKSVIEAETSGIVITQNANDPLNHQDVQQMICEIGVILGYYARTEFEYYDVIWRESEKSQRLSHVFEVQSKGNIDSALAKLKRAFQAQRSKPFLVLSSERDLNRAEKSLAQEFRELEKVITIIGFAKLRKIHENLSSIKEILPKFLDK